MTHNILGAFAAPQPRGTVKWQDPPRELLDPARAYVEDKVGVLYDTDPDRYGPIEFVE